MMDTKQIRDGLVWGPGALWARTKGVLEPSIIVPPFLDALAVATPGDLL